MSDAAMPYRPRFPFHSRARLHIDGASGDGLLVDISTSAALFAAERTLASPLGRRCRLEVLHGRLTLAAVAEGQIVQCDRSLLGIEFDGADGTLERDLMALVELNLGAPHLAKRKLVALTTARLS